MTEIPILIPILVTLIFIQNFIGVGLLVLGTPILLIMGFEFKIILSILLPISISTSFFSYIFMKNKKKTIDLNINNEMKYDFFLICVPSILIGLLILKYFEENINFNNMVAGIIIFSLLFKIFSKFFFKYINNFASKTVMFLIGTIHGLTNSGGTLLLLLIPTIHKDSDLNNRYNITYFYFYLALFQYLIFILFFSTIFNLSLFIVCLLSGIVFSYIANLIYKYINENLIKLITYIIAIISALMLIISNIKN